MNVCGYTYITDILLFQSIEELQKEANIEIALVIYGNAIAWITNKKSKIKNKNKNDNSDTNILQRKRNLELVRHTCQNIPRSHINQPPTTHSTNQPTSNDHLSFEMRKIETKQIIQQVVEKEEIVNE